MIPIVLDLRSLADETHMATPARAMTVVRGWGLKIEGEAMSGWVELGNGMAGFAVGLFLHAIPASWWPRWLRGLVGKVR